MKCKNCKNLMGDSSIGSCSEKGCGNSTSSSADKFCDLCSRKKNACQRCGKKLGCGC
ncbi:MAG: hypothetical protein K2W95_29945 [Candidatus Obscuribacterales bacterium]|nr:hypothetical protein [Candidatus Obscuribacterales bacterium]